MCPNLPDVRIYPTLPYNPMTAHQDCHQKGRPLSVYACRYYRSVNCHLSSFKFHICITFINLSPKFDKGFVSPRWLLKWPPLVRLHSVRSLKLSHLSPDFFQFLYMIYFDQYLEQVQIRVLSNVSIFSV